MIVGCVGLPGSGKTTLARSMCGECRKIPGINTVELVSEYARRYISKYGTPELFDQYRIMEKQIEWEDSVLNKYDLVITDSPVHQGFLYASDILKKNQKDVMIFNDIFKKLSKITLPEPRYDIIFYLPPVVKPVDDGIRLEKHLDSSWRKESDSLIKSIFKIFPPKKYIEVESTDINDRVKECTQHIKNYLTK